ncbi:MAG TPA: hypothetical protein VEA69_09110 [Tepidisphaeraceae bacterium]|nr:hypothetical protein [Tepidisphaeraceae bacterium]
MTTFCTDSDLLHWEPDLPGDALWVSQLLITGTGDLTESSFFTSSVSPGFNVLTGIEAGQVLTLGEPVNACFPIVERVDNTTVRVSTITAELFPESGGAPPPALLGCTSAADVSYAVRSFWAQRSVVSAFMLAAAGADPAVAAAEGRPAPAVLNPASLKRACVLGTIQMIYATLAAAAAEPAALQARADMYERLYRRALRQTEVVLDLDGDGRADVRKSLGAVQVARA